jgi:hypothetical protein
MGHNGDSVVTVTFAISRICFALFAKFFTINKYIGQKIIVLYHSCIKNLLVCQEFQESAKAMISRVKYRAILKLIVKREINMEFALLVGLLVTTVRELFKATNRTAFKIVSLNREINKVRFKA